MSEMNKDDNSNINISDSVKNDKKKKSSILPKIFGKKNNKEGSSSDNDNDGVSSDSENKTGAKRKDSDELATASPMMRKSFSADRQKTRGLEDESSFEQGMASETTQVQVFVTTWNVGGKTPNNGFNLQDFLQVENSADIYVCGFQEIVPLSAGNVLVSEDNEPAAKWLMLINQALNEPQNESIYSTSEPGLAPRTTNNNVDTKMIKKSSLKAITKSLKADGKLPKSCNCRVQFSPNNKQTTMLSLSGPVCILDEGYSDHQRSSSCDALLENEAPTTPCTPLKQTNYSLIASKQMVGLFLSVWARKELVPHIGHLRTSSVGRGIMGYLGNKGCITISMTLHRSSICFVCSHLASGEKEGDELKRNADVAEILKSTQLPKSCKSQNSRVPERITDHDRIIWLGDLNYRVALSYDETRNLLEDHNWDSLLEKDQLNIEREAGRVFEGFSEGHITFAPTYKYSQNSDLYAGETEKSKKKRRTPAWCDRILWRGDGVEQLSYIRGESKFSDHRPVSAGFLVDVETKPKSNGMFRKGYSCSAARLEHDERIPQRCSFYGC